MLGQSDGKGFITIKFIICILIFISNLTGTNKPFQSIGLEWLLIALFIISEMIYELVRRGRVYCLLISVLVLCCLSIFIGTTNSVILGFIISFLDFLSLFRLNFLWCGMIYFLLLFIKSANLPFVFIITLIIVIYYQNRKIINQYLEEIDFSNQEEYRLKQKLKDQQQDIEKKLRLHSLYSEQRITKDKSRIYQQLHDHLGHNINGAIYQLEAAKLLTSSKPEESEKILKVVIDHLRGSMDEIRAIFREERPTKRQMAFVELVELCERCKEEYAIDVTLDIEGRKEKIPEEILHAIIENVYEAISNALKYAHCTCIHIKIIVLNGVIRCEILDNGKGCSQIKEGMGLQGIKERVRNLQGTVSISGEAGFLIQMLFPIKKESEYGDNKINYRG